MSKVKFLGERFPKLKLPKIKWLKLILFFLIAYLNLSMNFYETVLTEEDFEMARQDQEQGAALTRPPLGGGPYWESYNEWRCFDRNTVELTCTELHHEDGSFNAYIAILSILVDDYLFEYHPLREDKQDCFPIAFQWFNLIKDEEEICIYGAYLNDFKPFDESSSDGSIWFIDQIKTHRGYWKTWEEEEEKPIEF